MISIVQLEYIVALQTYQSFGLAAEKCFISQPTLSAQIHKAEETLGIKIFDRSKKPIQPTSKGEEIVAQARVVLREFAKIQEIANEKQGIVQGEVHLGIIPTLAPYLLPLFLVKFIEKYPDVKISVAELTTEEIVQKVKLGMLDAGLLATPLGETTLDIHPIFYEPFVAYVSRNSNLFEKKTLDTGDVDIQDIWLVNEGHCLRSQVLNLCDKNNHRNKNFDYQTGSIEALKRIVEMDKGITILPELSVNGLKPEEMDLVRYFNDPEPVREISLVHHRNVVKKRLLNVLLAEIRLNIPSKMIQKETKRVIDI